MKSIYLILTCLFMNALWSQEPTTTIYLIRHAEKADASSDPDLSEAGKARAEKWAQYFKDKNIRIIYSTPYKRAMQTFIPISSTIDPIPGTVVEKTVRTYSPSALSLKEAAEKDSGKNILVVGHSNTIPGQINKLLGENKYPDMKEDEFGNLYIIKITGNKISHELIKM